MTKGHNKGTILLIEDEADIRKFVSRMLKLEGYHVLEAGDGDEGLRLARESRIALVLLDLGLPGRDGWSVLEEMKTDLELQTIPVIVFTASAGAAQREKAFNMGVAGYEVKPLSAASLKEAVVRILQNDR